MDFIITGKGRAITETTERVLNDVSDCLRRCKEIAEHRENVISQCCSTLSSLTSLPSLSLLTTSRNFPSQGETGNGAEHAVVQANLKDRYVRLDFVMVQYSDIFQSYLRLILVYLLLNFSISMRM